MKNEALQTATEKVGRFVQFIEIASHRKKYKLRYLLARDIKNEIERLFKLL